MKHTLMRILSLVLALTFVLSLLCGCQTDEQQDPAEDPIDAPTQDPTSDNTDEPGTTPDSGENPSFQEPAEPVVVGKGAVIGKTQYYTKDVVVANIIATEAPYNADPTGKTESTAAIQQALYDLDAQGGGVVYLPAGDYLISHTIFIPSGCVLQGDWQDPDEAEKGKAEYGTVILATPPTLTEKQLGERDASPLFMMDGCSGIVGMTFYYPEQSIEKPLPYGYTIYSEAPRTAVLRDITMINSYRGVGVGTKLTTGHEIFQNESVHICALETGVEMYLSTEVGYTVDLNVSPKYWIEAGRGWACSDAESLRDFCKQHTVGLIVQKLDDECLSGLTFDSCRTAIYMPKREATQQNFWGLIYDVSITNSMYGIVIEALTTATGAVIAKAEIEADEKAIVNSSTSGVLKLAGIELTGKGGISAEGGDIRYDENADLSDYEMRHGSYQKPLSYLYNAEIGDLSGVKEDAAPAIQAALDAAGKTGGIVYLPAGVYSLYSAIIVPENVQLRGPTPIFMRDATGQHPDGCLLISYVAEEATIHLMANAGVNGLRIFSPLYDAAKAEIALKNGTDHTSTMIGIKGWGESVYVYNVCLTGMMVGIDFADCDNHLIKQAFGCVYNTFAIVGGQNGVVESCLNNPHFINRQSFAELGYLDEDVVDIEGQKAYSHGQSEGTAAVSGFATLRDNVLRTYCTMIKVVDATNQAINNVFMYAPYEVINVSNSTATIINTSADFVGFGSVYRVEENSDVVIINSLRSVGDSLICDESSALDVYNRLNTEIYYEGNFHSADGNEDTFGFEVTDKTELGTENSVNGTKNVSLNTNKDYIKEGKYSYKHTPTATGTTEIIFEYSFAPMDISKYMNENGYLHMWVYVEDMSTQTWGGQIELTSGGKADTEEIYWVITSFLTHEGWNELYLPLADAKGSTFNPEKANYIRMFNTNNHFRSQSDFYIDDVYFCLAESDKIILPIEQATASKTEPLPSSADVYLPTPTTPDAPVVENQTLVVDNCETKPITAGSIPLKLNYNKDYVKEGEGSYWSEAGSRSNGMEIFLLRNKDGGWNISSYMKDGYLHFWLYVEDDEVFKSGQMELSSAGNFDKSAVAWKLATIGELKQGWNEVKLKLSDAQEVVSGFDPSCVNFMRLYLFTTDGTYGNYYIDDVYFYGGTATPSANPTVDPIADLIVDNCETKPITAGSIPLKLNYNKDYVKEGVGSYWSEAGSRSNGMEIFLLRNKDGGWNISSYMQDGYLHFWLYVEDAEVFKSGQMELSSAGNFDKAAVAWKLATIGELKQGWNEVVLKLSDAQEIASGFDPSCVNFMRLYLFTTDGTYGNYYIDDVYFTHQGK